MLLLKLFWSYFQIGLFSFGGGLAALPLVQNQVVDVHNWLTISEFTDLVTIAEMTPGPIAINAATFVGTKLAGFPGAVTATLGCVMPSFIIVTVLAWVYFRYKELGVIQGVLSGLRPAVFAMIVSAWVTLFMLAVWGEGEKGFDVLNIIPILLFGAGFAVLRRWRPNPVFVIMGSGVIGGVIYLLI